MNLNVYPFLLQTMEDFEKACGHVDAGNGFVSHEYAYEHDGKPDEFPCLAKFNCWDDPNGPYHCSWSFETQEELQEKIDRLKAAP
jgi:hypothetical protein